MKAFQLTGWQQPPELRDVAVPEPGPGEVLVEIVAAGACHSDLHLMDWPEGTLPFALPFTLGHENAGRIAALGAGVDAWQEGEEVVIYGPWGCGRCAACKQSKENYCERQAELGSQGGGLGSDGGMAEYMLVPSPRLLVPLDGLDPIDAAPLTDAGLTSYHAIKRSLQLLVPGSAAVVIGIGGLGHMAVQLLGALSPARVIAVDNDDGKLDLAREVGAEAAIGSDQSPDEAIAELTGGRGVELVLDMVGADATIALAAQVARPEADITIVGLAGGTLPFTFGATSYEASVTLPYWGSQVELIEVLALARAGKIKPHVERFSLDRVEDAYRGLREGSVSGRAVVCPGG